MTFWVLIFIVALLIAAFLCFALLRNRSGEKPSAAYDLEVYREQLAGVDKDLARGVIGEADAERVRTEISRRILAADEQMKKGNAESGPSRAVSIISVVVIALILIGGATALYDRTGAVGLPDMPLTARLELAEEVRANRPPQNAAEQLATPPQPAQLDESYEALLNQLRETVANRPDDLQGQMLLAQHETNAGNFKAGYTAQQRVIELSGDAATADAYADLAEMMILAAGGYVSPEAEQALTEALNRDRRHGPARYYWGQMLAQVGRPDLAYRMWVQTLQDSPSGAPWVGAIRAQIDELAFRAGVFNAPDLSTAAGPSQEDMAAAAELTPEERQEMIQGMVNQLSDRLATEGGAPEEWARLIAALGVLGQGQRAIDIHKEAMQVFAGNSEALEILDAAALQAGIAQ
ncbi:MULTISPECIES: c-type cytochrome biogenesis protein CcmI [unclassified Ruegeria]|uniref:c-type cytochrome biogenesis protein CcmI n=1 Tax=unclassified Ruegeria TaxID=2625375 RepID=UPI0014921042|nr:MULTISPECIES: c-type cytochrome biogenesis protein CcmI [unclassified Ruegeria]NOD46677.1 c-type cytochrome biogenesis protein CcmI [Ruegeria sp. HKCCD5849]NOD50023.1 c-type cytochrome biogenesis protein CcmI [Ruegeria sp. HKCCD5851]NOD66857.1 c-type cytochrome biogenesis protein CcmI [Ruegeria sp. HKCCD7303]